MHPATSVNLAVMMPDFALSGHHSVFFVRRRRSHHFDDVSTTKALVGFTYVVRTIQRHRSKKTAFFFHLERASVNLRVGRDS
jgi:hypothetical protein